MAEQQYETVSSISFKNCEADGKRAVKEEKTVPVGRIYGEASGIKSKEDRKGQVFSYLLGQFRFINYAGKGYESEKLFLPGGMLENIEAALKNATAVQFAYDVVANYVPANNIGYQYAAKAIIKTEAADRMTAMEKVLPAFKMIEAPKEEKKK
jgi:hypothetical protein